MPRVDDFMDEIVAEYRRRLVLLGDSGDRRVVEDGIALLTGLQTSYRAGTMDGERFEKLLSMLRAGRAPAGRSLLRPAVIGEELWRRWMALSTDSVRVTTQDEAPRGLKARAADTSEARRDPNARTAGELAVAV